MITIIYPYRNRELSRIKKSLDSLQNQNNAAFKVLFVDYGSTIPFANDVRELVSRYTFLEYQYSYNLHQPWSRAKAINIGLRLVQSPYVFIADIDMIFRTDFIALIYQLTSPTKAYYFKVGFLNLVETSAEKEFSDYQISFSSAIGAQGLSLFPTQALKEIHGFDEFLHFWGAEDIDIHNRLERTGVKSVFYNNEIVMLHQWHHSFRSSEKTTLTKQLQLIHIVKINHQHLLQNNISKKSIVNNYHWGNKISITDFQELENSNQELLLLNKVEVITHFLFCELPAFKNQTVYVRIVKDSFQDSLKYRIKKLIGKTVPKYFSLKEVNDMLLLHIISFYHTYPYSYEVNDDLKSITFKIKK